MDWDPDQVVIAGASEGSYGAIFHAPALGRIFAASDLITIGDSGVRLLKNYEGILERWGAGSFLRPLRNAEPDAPLTLERAYIQALLLGPLIRRATGKSIRLLAVPQDREAVVSIAELCEDRKVVPVIDRRYRLREVPLALSYVSEGRQKGKVVISLEG